MYTTDLIGILSVTVLLIISCSGQSDSLEYESNGVISNPATGSMQNRDAPLSFELIDTIDLFDMGDEVISRISFLQIDTEGNLYFMDNRASRLYSVDAEGDLRWATGQEGKGPGDFENPFGMSMYEDHLYISNVIGSRIDQFDLDGNFVRSYDMPKGVQYVSLEDFTEDGNLLASSANFGTVGAKIYTLALGDTVRIVTSFDIQEEVGEEFERASTRGALSLLSGEIVYSYNSAYVTQYYSYEGELLREVHREFDGTLGPGIYATEGSVTLYSFGRVGSPVLVDNGMYLVNVRYPTNVDDPNAYARKAQTGGDVEPVEYDSFMDIYSRDHQLLYTIEDDNLLDELGSLSIRDANGFYYSADSDDLVIRKYRIRY